MKIEEFHTALCREGITCQVEFQFFAFEISARIVAGTNVNIPGSPYSEFIEPGLTTGRRIARELKLAQKTGKLASVLT